ncbi:ATP-binding protein, partial [Phocaeicola dorei]
SGIGLSLCKQIMNLHGGSISASSEIGKGSCFTLKFLCCG